MSENEMRIVEARKVQELNERARKLMCHLSTHFVGAAYKFCLEELGLWENEDEQKK